MYGKKLSTKLTALTAEKNIDFKAYIRAQKTLRVVKDSTNKTIV